MKRLFISIPLPVPLSNSLKKVKENNLKIQNVNWTKPENFHITLCFLGNISDEMIFEITILINEIARSQTPFVLKPKEILLYPPKNPRMIWLSFNENEFFNKLYNNLHEALKYYLNKPVHNVPKAHVTLARLKYLPKAVELYQREKA